MLPLARAEPPAVAAARAAGGTLGCLTSLSPATDNRLRHALCGSQGVRPDALRADQAGSPYANAGSQPRACLLDVYDTILTCDFERLLTEVAAAAGVPAGTWADGISQLIPALNDGRLSMSEGFEQILRASGLDPAPDLVRTLTGKDRDLLFATTLVFEDTIPFLELLRSR